MKGQDPAPRKARLLVAEDDPATAEVAQEMFGALGHDCDVFGGGAACLEAFARRSYGAAFLDLDLPDMTGLDLARRVRAAEQAAGSGRRTPIIALTGSTESDVREQCMAAGMDDFVAKPYGFGELRRSLARWLVPEHAGGLVLEASAIEAIRLIEKKTGRRILPGIVTSYLDSFGQLLSAMDEAAARRDFSALRSSAHTLKGSSAQLGAHDLAARCLELERSAAAGDPSNVTALIASIRLAGEAVRLQLEREVAQPA